MISSKTSLVMVGVLLLHGMIVRAINMETVPVGNPGNTGELSGSSAGGYGPDRICGAVAYDYRIATYEVTTGQYTEFLNKVAKTDTYGLYSTSMADIVNSYGCNIKRSGSSGSYTYTVGDGSPTDVANYANRPVNYVSWGDSARFANWMHNGQPTGAQGLSTTEDGAYYLNGATTNAQLLAVNRESDWKWAITSEDEWYKAAYHKNDGVTGNYWDYPTGTNSVPSNVLTNPDPGNNANFYQNGYTIDPFPYWRTEVGEFENSDSPYGTFDQGGNVWEWNESVLYDSSRGLRGGACNRSDALYASGRYLCDPWQASNSIGFRVVQLLPDPTDVVASFPFDGDAEGWTLEAWKAGQYDLGTIAWDSANGNPGGNIKSTGSGTTNNTDSCTREGGMMTRQISTSGYRTIQIEYDVIASLNTPPAAGCTSACQSAILEGSCEDKLVVYYSTDGTSGPWNKVQELNEGDDLPTSWTHKWVSLAGVTAAEGNPNFTVCFKWQFNTAADIGRIDNVTVKGTPGTNQTPTVDAGQDQTIGLSTGASLNGTVTDDGWPNPPGQVAVTWSKTSGPGTVTVGDANAVDTTVSFSMCGIYILRLTATDSELSAYDEVTITALPGQATNPNPADGATEVSVSTALSWTAGGGATSHKVYFGTSNPPTYRTEQSGTTYSPGTLQNDATYYWRIDEVSAVGTTTGELWSFSTIVAMPGQATDPSPANGAIDVSLAADLAWSAGDRTTSHKVYFGTTNPPQYKATQTSTSYDLGPLSRQTTYYWRIDEVNAGGTTTGDLWSFATITLPGDFDHDSDVDLTDFGHLQACYSGPSVPPATGCDDADLDGDNDVDQADYTQFKACLGGPLRPPGC